MDLHDITHLKYGLFRKRRFLPIFLSQFLAAFNDNMLRNGLVVLIAYADKHDVILPIQEPAVLVTLCAVLLILPYILFSSIAGQLADKCEKAQLISYVKLAEIGIMLFAAYGFMVHNIYILMVTLFFSGTHSTFFGPIKYSILPEHLAHREMLTANGFMSAGNYLATLIGLICGGILVEMPHNIIGLTLLIVALIGYAASLYIPRAHAVAPDTQVNFNLWSGTWDIINFVRGSKRLWNGILGLSWFLLVGSVFMTQFANFARESLQASNEVYIVFLTVFSVGIAIGAVLADVLLKGEVSIRLAPWALSGVTLFTVLMVATTPAPAHEGLLTVSEFFDYPLHWLVVFSMLMVALCGGIYMVPFYSLLQTESDPRYRSRVMAASNLSDSLFMTIAAIICTALLSAGVGITGLFMILAVLNLGVLFHARKLVTLYANPAT